jgi:hypothetical protein
MLRVKLIEIRDEEHALILTQHHIVSDAWSIRVLVREVGVLYETFSKGDPSPLLDLKVQYADYAAWQRQWLDGAALESQLAYWSRRLGGKLPLLDLPTDNPRPPMPSYQGAIHPFSIQDPLFSELKALSREEGCTLFMTVLAAYQALLHLYSGQTDILVGTPIANRNRIETEGLIGFLVNTLVMRTEMSGDPSFRQLMGRVREVTLGAYANQDLPFEMLVEKLQPKRNLNRNPIFQVWFAFHNTVPVSEILYMPGLEITPLAVKNRTSLFDLMLDLTLTPEGLIGGLQYSTDLFNHMTVARIVRHFQTLLQEVAMNPDQRLSETRVIPQEEYTLLNEDFNTDLELEFDYAC